MVLKNEEETDQPEATAIAGEEQETPEAPEKPRRKKRFPLSVSLPVTIGLAVLLFASIAAGVTFGLLFKGKADIDSAKDAAPTTARSYAVTVTTHDYQNLDKNFADVLEGATGEFKDQYTGASATLRQLIQQAKATAKGNVIDAG